MKNITNLSEKIFNKFISSDVFITCQTEDDGAGDMIYVSENVVVSDDSEKEDWYVSFQLNEDTPFEECTKILSDLFGEPTHPRGDKRINNWNVNKVLIVHRDDHLELIQYYSKV